jgi:predicted Rossmann fold flavoprotein
MLSRQLRNGEANPNPEPRVPGPESGVVDEVDVLVVGAGAAGLAAAIFTARAAPALRVRVLDGARRIGAKILVSGGSRCNVTNRTVTDRDFWGGPSHVVRKVLRAFPAERAVHFFQEIGVELHEEQDGKLFPDSQRSHTVLDALLAELQGRGITLGTGERVQDAGRTTSGFVVKTVSGSYHARRLVLATGGRSLPKTGSDGFGYELARRLGHGYVETTPALAPLVLTGGSHEQLSGVSHRVALVLRADGAPARKLAGQLLWTHFGVSGPVALDMSRHWHRARLEGRSPAVTVNVCPDESFETLDRWFVEQQTARPKARVTTALATRLPSSMAGVWIDLAQIDRETILARVAREDRRCLVRSLVETPLEVVDSRGYGYAEVTAGGVPLEEIDPATMESRVCRGLHLVGEVLDVDGRLGGFNFQWAWSSGWVAGNGIAAMIG